MKMTIRTVERGHPHRSTHAIVINILQWKWPSAPCNMALSHNFTMQLAFLRTMEQHRWHFYGCCTVKISIRTLEYGSLGLSWAPRNPSGRPYARGSRGRSWSLLSFPGLSWVKDVWISCGHRPIFSLRHVSSSSALWGQGTIETTLPDLNLTRTRQELEFAAWDSNARGGGVGPDPRVALFSGPWLKWFSFVTAFKKDMASAPQNMSIFTTAQLAHFWKIKNAKTWKFVIMTAITEDKEQTTCL